MGLLLATFASAPPAAAQYELVWEDDFDGNSLDFGKWEPQIGNGCPALCGWGNNELQYYRAENATVAGGMLTITAKEEPFAGHLYTSARLRTKNLASWKYGRFEMRAKLPIGQGLWPAFWMLPEDDVYGDWAASGEIDVMELIGQEPDRVHGTIHYGDVWPGNTFSGGSYTLPGGTFNDDFHVFSLEWDETEIRWYVDGILYSTKTSWWSTGGPYPAPFDQPFHLLLNVAVGGDWPGPPDATTQFPQTMVVDYVRVYQQAGLAPYSEDFESFDPFGPTALGGAGWKVFANVFDGLGNYLYGYGPFPAPNGGPGFCAVATGQGGAAQGAQQLVTYSDYGNGDHANGFTIESNVFQEQVVAPGDVGKTFTFQFDVRLGDLAPPSNALAFIKVVDADTFGLDAFVTVDTTSIPTWETRSVSLTIAPDHVGDFFQIGFLTNATNYDPSGVLYDNIVFGEDCNLVTYCNPGDGNPGNGATISASGCDLTSSISVDAANVPPFQNGYLIVGDGQGTASPNLGTLCVIGLTCIGRYNLDVQNSGVAGTFSTDVSNSLTGGAGYGLPAACTGTIAAGETWYFQYWHRVAGGGDTFSEAICITFK